MTFSYHQEQTSKMNAYEKVATIGVRARNIILCNFPLIYS